MTEQNKDTVTQFYQALYSANSGSAIDKYLENHRGRWFCGHHEQCRRQAHPAQFHRFRSVSRDG